VQTGILFLLATAWPTHSGCPPVMSAALKPNYQTLAADATILALGDFEVAKGKNSQLSCRLVL
jgi:hypothetical protein